MVFFWVVTGPKILMSFVGNSIVVWNVEASKFEHDHLHGLIMVILSLTATVLNSTTIIILATIVCSCIVGF